MSSSLRKIVNEEVIHALQCLKESEGSKKTAHTLKNKINFLYDFDIKKSGNNYGYFYYQQNENEYFVEIKKESDGWFLKGVIDGKLDVDDGGTFNIGPIHSFDEFIWQVNKQMDNNPILDPFNLHDEMLRAVDKELLIYIDKVIDKKEEIKKLPKEDLKDLKDLIKIMDKNKNLSKQKLLDRLREDFRTDNMLLNTLRKVEQLELYKGINKYYK